MKLQDYLESVYVMGRKNKNPTTYDHGRMDATSDVMKASIFIKNLPKNVCKFVAYVELVVKFGLIKAGVLKKPLSAKEMIEQEMKLMEERKNGQTKNEVNPGVSTDQVKEIQIG